MELKSLFDQAMGTLGALLKKNEVRTLSVNRGDTESAEILILPRPDGSFQTVTPRNLLEDYRLFPDRRKGKASITSLASFIAHVNRMKDDESAIFLNDSNRARPECIAVYDYHKATKPEMFDLARNLEHRSVYTFPVSDEWNAWLGIKDKWLDQATFAAWLEERIVDVLEPAAAGETVKRFAVELGAQLATKQQLFTLSKGLALNVERRLANKVNLSSGEAQFIFEENHTNKDGGTLSVPGGFAIAIPVWRAGDLFQVPVRLRYRPGKESVMWQLALYGVDRIFDVAIDEAEKTIAAGTELPVFRGLPEQ